MPAAPRHSRFLRFAALLATLGTLAPIARATSYYVSSSTGDDANAGTDAASPWRTLGKVNQTALAAGDRVYLLGGDSFADAGLAFGPTDTGTASNPIVVTSYGTGRATIAPTVQPGISIHNTAGITVSELDLTGTGQPAINVTHALGVSLLCDFTDGRKLAGITLEDLGISGFYQGILVGATDPSFSGFQDVTINDCTVHDCLADGIVTYGYYPGSATQQSHQNLRVLATTVYRCFGDLQTTASTSGSGIVMSGTIGGLIDRCIAHDNGGTSGQLHGGGPVGIWCWGCAGVTIQHCLVYNESTNQTAGDGGGFDIDGGATDCTIQYCYSYNNAGPGYEIVEFLGAPPLANATVRYNLSWMDGRAGQPSLSAWSGHTDAASFSGGRFYNNTVVSAGTSNPVIRQISYSGPFSVLFANNVLLATGGAQLVDIAENTASYTFAGNLYYSSGANPQWNWGSTTYASLAAWRAAPGNPKTQGQTTLGLYADPQLTAPSAGFAATNIDDLLTMTALVPLTGSPAIDAGQDLTTAAFGSLAVGDGDFVGTPIPSTHYDIGAYDLSATPAASGGARLVNISTRSYCGGGNNVAIGGFVISGSAPKQVLLRAVGPSLATAGVPAAEVLADPVIELHDAIHGNTIIATDDNWSDSDGPGIVAAANRVGATPLADSDDKSSALLLTLNPGVYSFVVSGKNNTTGIVLTEVYDADASPGGSTLANISGRCNGGTGNNVAIAGFVVSGSTPKRVLLRAVGPSLASQGIAAADTMADPYLEVHDALHGNGTIANNDDWTANANSTAIVAAAHRIGATAFDASDTKSAALLLTLDPGVYSFVVSGRNNTTGIVLAEVYDAD